MGSGLRRNAISQRGFVRMPLSSATQPLGCHPREFGAFYSPSTPPFSFPFTVAIGTDGTGATNGSSSQALLLRRRGTPRLPARSTFPRPANPPQPRAPPRPPALRELPHAFRCLTSGRRAPATPTRAAAARSTKTSSSPRRTGQLSPHPPFPCPCQAFSPTTSSSLRSGLG